MAKREPRFFHVRTRVWLYSLAFLSVVAIGGLAGAWFGWRVGLLRCAPADGGYLCGVGSGPMVVFAPGFKAGQELLGAEVGWLTLMADLSGLRLGVVDAAPEDLVEEARAFIDRHDGTAALGFSLGGRATLALAEHGDVDRAAVVCAPADLAAVTGRFATLVDRLDAAGVVGPDPALRADFDVWRAVYDEETVPALQSLDATLGSQGMVDGWLEELEMPWVSDWERYLAIRSAFWLDGRATLAELRSVPPVTGALNADLLQIHNQLDPVVPLSQMGQYQRLADEAGTGDRITVRVIEGFGHCKLGPADWLYLMRWMKDLE